MLHSGSNSTWATWSKTTLNELLTIARNLRDRHRINFPTYFFNLHKSDNLVKQKINQSNINQARLREYRNK